MKEFDVFESSIKDSLDGYIGVKPSRKIWLKITASLFLIGLWDSLFWKSLLIATISSFGIASYIYYNNIGINDLVSEEVVLNTNINSDEKENKLVDFNEAVISNSNSTNLINNELISNELISNNKSKLIDTVGENEIDNIIVDIYNNDINNGFILNEKLNIVSNDNNSIILNDEKSKINKDENPKVIIENIVLVDNSNKILENSSISNSEISISQNTQSLLLLSSQQFLIS